MRGTQALVNKVLNTNVQTKCVPWSWTSPEEHELTLFHMGHCTIGLVFQLVFTKSSFNKLPTFRTSNFPLRPSNNILKPDRTLDRQEPGIRFSFILKLIQDISEVQSGPDIIITTQSPF